MNDFTWRRSARKKQKGKFFRRKSLRLSEIKKLVESPHVFACEHFLNEKDTNKVLQKMEHRPPNAVPPQFRSLVGYAKKISIGEIKISHGGSYTVTVSEKSKIQRREEASVPQLTKREISNLCMADLAEHGTEEDILQKLREGGNLEEEGDFGNTCLMSAIAHGRDAAFVTFLLAQGADVNHVNRCGTTPLLRAAISDASLKVVEVLLHAGADPTFRNKKGRSALDIFGDREKAEILALIQQ